MKNFFKKIKSYSFWVSFSGALIVLLNALGRAFNFEIENQIVEDCIMAIAGVLVVVGIVTMNDKTSQNSENVTEDTQDQEKSSTDQNETTDAQKTDEKQTDIEKE